MKAAAGTPAEREITALEAQAAASAMDQSGKGHAAAAAASPPLVDLCVGGARVLTGVSASTPLPIDTSSLPPGDAVVRAVATDEAGNQSLAAQATIQIVP